MLNQDGPGAGDMPSESADAMRLQELHQKWARVRGRLRQEVGDAAFKSWLQPLTLLGVETGTVTILVPSRFKRDWIDTHFSDRILALWCQEDSTIKRLDYRIEPIGTAESGDHGSASQDLASQDLASQDLARRDPGGQIDGVPPGDAMSAAATTPVSPSNAPELTPGQTPRLDQARIGPTKLAGANPSSGQSQIAALDPRFTFDAFVVAKSNELAHAAAHRVADSLEVSFNPLFLYSGVGLGKTHLMHAIAWHSQASHPNRRVVYMSAEKFMNQFIRALRMKDTVAFKEQFRSVDLLMIDDVQFIIGKDSTQEEFFHTFNALVDQNKQIVLSADKSPSDLEGLEERLRSRLGWGLVADIHATTYELRLGILESKAERLEVNVPHKVLEFLGHRITSNVRELEGALNRIAAHATLVGRPITLETTQEVLHDLLRANDRRVTIADIQRKVAEHFNIHPREMTSHRKSRSIARPRQIAMYLSKQLTQRSLPEIGKHFGGRDHTTVMYAVRKVEELQALDSVLAEDIEVLRRMLES